MARHTRPPFPVPNRTPYVWTPPPPAYRLPPADMARQRARLRSIASWFRITINPIRYVTPCAEWHAQRDRGLIGFHDCERCADCTFRDAGYEAWGGNGHMQNRLPDRASLLLYLAREVQGTRIATCDPFPGAVLGTRFSRGGPITYLG